MATKPFIVKNGLSVNDTTVLGTNGKLHGNNVLETSDIQAKSALANTNLAISDRIQVANTNTLIEGAKADALAFSVALG